MRLYFHFIFICLAGIMAAGQFSLAQSPVPVAGYALVYDRFTEDWPHSNTDASPDDRAVYGRLANGLRYVVIPVPDIQGRLSIHMQVLAGFRDETPEQTGTAHLLEHMAFQGSSQLAPNQITEELRARGLDFGVDANAFTMENYTVYKFDFPEATTENLDRGLFFLSEIAQNLTLDPVFLETERKIVGEELRLRDTPDEDAKRARRYFTSPQDVHWSVDTAAALERLELISADDLRSYYEEYYRPENSLLVIAGEVDADAAARIMSQHFSIWPRGAQIAAKDKAQTKPGPMLREQIYYKAGAYDQFALIETRPSLESGPGRVFTRDIFKQALAMNMFTARLNRIAEDEKSIYWYYPDYTRRETGDIAEVTISSYKNDRAVVKFDQERRRIIESGFSQSEIDQAMAERTNALQSLVGDGRKINSLVVAHRFAQKYAEGRIYRNPQQSMAETDAWAKSFTPEDYRAAFADMWDDFKPRYWARGETLKQPGLDDIKKSLESSRKRKLRDVSDQTIKSFKLKGLGKPGTVTARDTLPGTDITRLTFSNGAKVNIRSMHSEADKVAVSLSIRSDFSKIEPHIKAVDMMLRSMSRDDIKGYTKTDMDALFAGKMADFAPVIINRSVVLNAQTRPNDLDATLSLMTGFLTRFDRKSKHWQQSYNGWNKERLQAEANSPLYLGLFHIDYLLSSFEPRFFVEPDGINKDLAKLISDYIKTGTIEVGIAGDIEVSAVIESLRRTIGALPKRGSEEALTASVPGADLALMNKTEYTLKALGDARDMALVYCWPNPEPNMPRSVTQSALLTKLLEAQLFETVRTKLGATYTVSVTARPAAQFPGFHYICGAVQIESENEDAVREALEPVLKSLGDGEVSAAEFDKVIAPLRANIAHFETNKTEMAHWITYASTKPEWVRTVLAYPEWAENVTIEDVKVSMRAVFNKDSMRFVRVELTD